MCISGLCNVPHSCDEIHQTNYSASSGYYIIDPVHSDDIDVFPVYCNLSGSTVTTVIHHNLENRATTPNLITAGQGQYATYKRPLNYSNNGTEISVQQLAMLVDQFQTCRYHYKHECSDNKLVDTDWVDRNGIVINDWAGTSTMCRPCRYDRHTIYQSYLHYDELLTY